MPNKFTLIPHIILRAEPQYYDTYIAFDRNGTRTEFLTIKEYSLLDYLHSHSGTADEISLALSLPPKECKKLLKQLLRRKLIQIENYNDVPNKIERVGTNSQLFRDFDIPFLSAPSSVDIFVTSRCNLRCIHCFSARDETNFVDLEINDFIHLIDELESLGILEIRINGGEPLTHPDIKEILGSFKGRTMRRVMITNGTLLNDEIIDLIKESEVIPTVSLDDHRDYAHDKFRGVKGAFKATLRGLTLLKQHEVQFGINTCLHRGNIGKFNKIIKLAKQLGAYRIAFLDLKRTGRMLRNQNWIPSREEYDRTKRYLDLSKAITEDIDISTDIFIHCPPLEESIKEGERGYISCSAGKARMSIDSDGGVYPCNMVLGDPNWNMGNVLQEEISDIWFSERWAFFRGKVKMKDLTTCFKCRDRDDCQDLYCRLYPYLVSGDPYGPSPDCNQGRTDSIKGEK
jgi:radical SAM protein with 4Fe4S-binding SPASM domain